MKTSSKDLRFFAPFKQHMLSRLKMGQKEYGNSWREKRMRDHLVDMQEELVDMANYAAMQYTKLQNMIDKLDAMQFQKDLDELEPQDS